MLDFLLDPEARSYPTVISQCEDHVLLESPAKVNLSLRVLGRRPDGYHELETWFQEVSLCDTVRVEKAQELDVRFVGQFRDIPPENLVTRAVRAMAVETGCGTNLRVTVDKWIPIGGGLGGGSSNAVAAMLGINILFKLNLSAEKLVAIARNLGADCPFFVYGGLCKASGRGDQPQPDPSRLAGALLLVLPPFGVDTARAFENARFRLTHMPKNGIFESYAGTAGFPEVKPASLFNDLEDSVFASFPLLQEIKSGLLAAGAVDALMSGSGSTVFGVFASEEEAAQAAKHFPPPLQVRVCRPVARDRSTVRLT